MAAIFFFLNLYSKSTKEENNSFIPVRQFTCKINLINHVIVEENKICSFVVSCVGISAIAYYNNSIKIHGLATAAGNSCGNDTLHY